MNQQAVQLSLIDASGMPAFCCAHCPCCHAVRILLHTFFSVTTTLATPMLMELTSSVAAPRPKNVAPDATNALPNAALADIWSVSGLEQLVGKRCSAAPVRSKLRWLPSGGNYRLSTSLAHSLTNAMAMYVILNSKFLSIQRNHYKHL